SHDARKEFANTLTEAEKQANKGILELKIWRLGKTMDVTLKLKVMGTYSFTTDCRKSRIIIDQACSYFKKHGLRGAYADEGVGKCISALALLATGREELLPMVRKHAHELAARVQKRPLNIESHVALASWKWGYGNLFLTEYYLATKDEHVLPAIKEYATKLAMGQTGAGTWGHMMAHLAANNGKLHGSKIGYGSMNQSTLVCAISLVLAQKCGVNNEEIAQAIERSAGFFRYYVDRGGIPYGEHDAIRGQHATNGKTASAAILFDLLGDEEAATFFSQMAVAGYNGRERGHSGFFFSLMWGALGAARCGDEAAAAYMHERQWYLDLERRWTGDFAYQGVPGIKTFPKRQAYRGWGMTAARLLQYCLPLKELYITGRGGHTAKELDGNRLAETIRYGRNFGQAPDVTKPQLLQLLGSWSPAVRMHAARALGDRKEAVGDQLVAMLDSPDRYVRYGASLALGHAGNGSSREVETIVQKCLLSKDLILVENGIEALVGERYKMHRNTAVSALLRVAATEYPQDPQRAIQRRLCIILFGPTFGRGGGILRNSIDGVDRGLLIPAIKNMLRVQNTSARISLSRVFEKLTLDEMKPLFKDIYYLTEVKERVSGMGEEVFHRACFLVLLKYRIREGLDLVDMNLGAGSIAVKKKGGTFGNVRFLMKALPGIAQYGAAAQEYLPALRNVQERYRKQGLDKVAGIAADTIKKIEKGAPVKLFGIAELTSGGDAER
ncbi:MAG: DUF6288 domain-containing protein, partial [Planctomycetota bacterium]